VSKPIGAQAERRNERPLQDIAEARRIKSLAGLIGPIGEIEFFALIAANTHRELQATPPP
jgi:hypothetical protein